MGINCNFTYEDTWYSYYKEEIRSNHDYCGFGIGDGKEYMHCVGYGYGYDFYGEPGTIGYPQKVKDAYGHGSGYSMGNGDYHKTGNSRY